MTTDEIRALADSTKNTIAQFDPPLGPHAPIYHLISAIETLLARQDEVMESLNPGEKPNYMDPKYNPSKMPPLTEYNLDCMWHGMRKQAYARACEIAGRAE